MSDERERWNDEPIHMRTGRSLVEFAITIRRRVFNIKSRNDAKTHASYRAYDNKNGRRADARGEALRGREFWPDLEPPERKRRKRRKGLI